MALKFCSISSGSTGNCYLIKTDTTAVLVDAGISGKRILKGLEETGTKLEDVQAVLVTHEHIDHVKSVKTLVKKINGVKVCSNRATFDCFYDPVIEPVFQEFSTGETLLIGDIEVTSFRISHDAAEPVGYSFVSADKRISLVTDTGTVTKEIFDNVKSSDILVVEANHDVHTLQFCKYPYATKRRIAGEKGHLSNEAAGELIRDILLERSEPKLGGADSGKDEELRVPVVLLAHLSKENNFPEMAMATINNTLEAAGFFCGKDVELEVLKRDGLSDIYCL